jgi:hypothetical protein
MAYAMVGGIIVGTVLALLFLPALYVAWFRIEEEQPGTVGREDIPDANERLVYTSNVMSATSASRFIRETV